MHEPASGNEPEIIRHAQIELTLDGRFSSDWRGTRSEYVQRKATPEQRESRMSTTTIDHVGRPRARSTMTKLSVAGAICYVLWGCLHLMAAYAVYRVGAALAPGMAQARIFQDSWNLLFFGVTGIAVALTLNIRNNAWGYWINLGVLALADTGLIFFVLIPGYMPLWPGVAGPVLWILGGLFTTLGYFRMAPVKGGIDPTA
ncbi:MAG TPA: hypothetical protein VE267_19315 [Bradyrhizobium sp.]|nr:hypothetical protein [Bradyrhizobium sp.]